ncbi:MAG: hypothetical protein Q4C68_06060 [Moraxella sp.]|nr:hypothetical protein [Moraxella sp.]
MALKEVVKSLPLDSISEALAAVVLWWIRLVKDVPEDKLPVYTYLGASILVLILLYLVLRLLPKSIRGILWIIAAAVLLTPGPTLGETGEIAPAIIGVLHGFLMDNQAQAMAGLTSITAVIVVGLVLGVIWQLLRKTIESKLLINKEKKRQAQEEEQRHLASEEAARSRIQSATAAPIITTDSSNYSDSNSHSDRDGKHHLSEDSKHHTSEYSDTSANGYSSSDSGGGDSGGGGGD